VSKIKDRRDKCYLNNTKCREFLYEDLKDRIGVSNELIIKDCVYDERLLRNAIRKFQHDNNLKCDGMPGRKTLAALGYSEEEIEALMLFYSSYYKEYVGLHWWNFTKIKERKRYLRNIVDSLRRKENT
jgi:hypothetical protein